MAAKALSIALPRYSRHLLVFALFALMAVSALAESTDAASVEQRVDRLLWQLVNDERYSHLQVAANYEQLYARLLEQACLVSAAPCAHSDAVTQQAHVMTSEVTPQQEVLVEQLLFSIQQASATTVQPPAHQMVTVTE